MAKIYQIPTPLIGTSGTFPTPKFAVFGDNLSTITQPGYLSAYQMDGEAYPLSTNDILNVFYSYNQNTQSGTFGLFTVSISGSGVITLVQASGGSGSGTVDAGLAGQLAYYAANGTVVEGLSSTNNSVLIMNNAGEPAWQALGQDQVILGRAGDVPYPATLTAGSNITITSNPGANTVTIAATGGSGSGTVNAGLQNQMAYYAANGTAVSGLATANNGALVTNGSGVPSISTTLPNMNIGTPTAGVLTNCTNLPVGSVSGAGNSSIIATNGSGVAAGVGPLTNGQLVIGSTGATPVAAALTAGSGVSISNGAGSITIATTSSVNAGSQNQIAYYAANGSVVSGLATANNGVMVTDSSGVPSIATTLPNVNIGTPSAGVLTNCTGLPVGSVSGIGNSSVVVTNNSGVAAGVGPLTNGQIIIGSTGNTPAAATLTAGSGVSITNGAGNITISATGSGGMQWNNVTGTSQAAAVNNGYVSSNASLTTFTLPATATIGSIVAIQGAGAGGWTISLSGGQSVVLNSGSASSSVSSTQQYDVIYLMCIVANTTWAYNGGFGNYSLV